LNEQKDVFYNSSSSLAALVDYICPRYIYSSIMDVHYKRMPYLNEKGFLTRFITLGSIPGKYKPTDSKQMYIQAIELEPLIQIKELLEPKLQPGQDYLLSPFQGTEHLSLRERVDHMYDLKLAEGKRLLDLEE